MTRARSFIIQYYTQGYNLVLITGLSVYQNHYGVMWYAQSYYKLYASNGPGSKNVDSCQSKMTW